MTDEPTEQIQQRRHFTRIPFDADYRLHDPNTDRHWVGKVVDLSLKGALIACPENFQPIVGNEYVIELVLGENNLKVVMLVSIAHHENGHIGFHCLHIDLESISHLRKLLEFNLGKPEMVEREIAEMIHLAMAS